MLGLNEQRLVIFKRFQPLTDSLFPSQLRALKKRWTFQNLIVLSSYLYLCWSDQTAAYPKHWTLSLLKSLIVSNRVVCSYILCFCWSLMVFSTISDMTFFYLAFLPITCLVCFYFSGLLLFLWLLLFVFCSSSFTLPCK